MIKVANASPLDSSCFLQIKWDYLLVAAKLTLSLELRNRSEAPVLHLLRWQNAETIQDQMDALVNWD